MDYIGANLQLVRENKKRDDYFAPETVLRMRNLMHIKDSSASQYPSKESLASIYDMLKPGHITPPPKKPDQQLPPVEAVPISTVMLGERKRAGSDADYTPEDKRARTITSLTEPRVLDKVISSLCSQDNVTSTANIPRLPDQMASQVPRPATDLGAALRRIWQDRPIVPLAPLDIPDYVLSTVLPEESVDEDVKPPRGSHEDAELDDEESSEQELTTSEECWPSPDEDIKPPRVTYDALTFNQELSEQNFTPKEEDWSSPEEDVKVPPSLPSAISDDADNCLSYPEIESRAAAEVEVHFIAYPDDADVWFTPEMCFDS
jgi:hypothetical protein